MSNIDPIEEHQKVVQFYEEYLDLFTHPGWKRFIDDINSGLEQDQKTAVARCDTDQKWFEERGAQAKTLRIAQFETLIRNSYDQFLEQDTLEEEDED